MYKVTLRKNNREKRKLRVRKKIVGTSERPRLSIFRSNKYIYCQLIDDVEGITLTSVNKEVSDLHKGKNKIEAAYEVGKLIAKKALEKGIKQVVFDRNGYRYHGRVKSLADGAREGGVVL
ncbi:50S ribosomal protein L18 [Patescibacteria group bacterium]|nr:50S ribosomal protein L18 [Patescibacteria group bacterium]